jgi:hypothetical protein
MNILKDNTQFKENCKCAMSQFAELAYRNDLVILLPAREVLDVLSEKNIPLENKPLLTLNEASHFTEISREKLMEITNSKDCPFVLWVGNRRFIKRRIFNEFIKTGLFEVQTDERE